MAAGRVVELGIGGLTDAVLIGRGGFAVVYRAFQPAFDRFVAVKVFGELAVDESTPTVFERECRAIGRISGRSNILTVYEAGTSVSGRPYLVMAYMARGSLEDRLQREGPLPWREAVGIGVKLAKALQVAHEARVLHRDVKPDNVLMSDDGEPLLADFGIARLTDVARRTRSRSAFTAVHAAPEVVVGRSATAAVDIYSLSSTVFALIVGHPAFVEGADDSDLAVMHRVAEAPVPDLLRPRGVPEALCRLIEAAMAKEPSERPPSAAAFGAALETALAREDEAARQASALAAAATRVAALETVNRIVAQREETGSPRGAEDEADREADEQAQGGVDAARASAAGVPAPVEARRGHRHAYAFLVIIALVVSATLVVVYYPKPLSYAAVVNGTEISKATINQDLADIAGNPQYVQQLNQNAANGGSGSMTGPAPGSFNKAFIAVLLNQQIKFEVIRQRLAATKSTPSESAIDSARSEMAQELGQALFDAFPRRYQQVLTTQQAEADAFNALVGKAAGADDAIRLYYEAHQNDYATEACVRHILVAKKDAAGQIEFPASLTDAKKLKADLAAGADFAALAKSVSQDNQGANGGSAAQGGALTGSAADGCLTTSDLQQFIVGFAPAVVAVPLKQVSDPVKTQFGYHLIEVTSRAIEPLDANVTKDIRQRIASDQLDKLVSQAKIKVNPDFGTFNNNNNKVDKSSGLIP